MVNYSTFLFLAAMLVIMPGPDYVMITKNTLIKGKLAGFFTLVGTLSALSCHTIFAVVGLSALLVKSAMLYGAVKYLGAFYLFYLGIKALFFTSETKNEQKDQSVYLQGLLTNLFNPKVAIFFLTFLPQFIAPDNKSWLPFALLGMTYILVTALIFSIYILFLEQVRGFMEKPQTKLLIDKVSGIVLVVFGLKLLLEKK